MQYFLILLIFEDATFSQDFINTIFSGGADFKTKDRWLWDFLKGATIYSKIFVFTRTIFFCIMQFIETKFISNTYFYKVLSPFFWQLGGNFS